MLDPITGRPKRLSAGACPPKRVRHRSRQEISLHATRYEFNPARRDLIGPGKPLSSGLERITRWAGKNENSILGSEAALRRRGPGISTGFERGVKSGSNAISMKQDPLVHQKLTAA